MSAEELETHTVGPCLAAESSAWPGEARCPERWPDIPRGWCWPCKITEGAQEMGTPAAGFTRVGATVYPHGPVGLLSRLSAADRLVPEDYKPRISEEERNTIPSYGELIVARLEHEARAQGVDLSAPVPVTDALDLLALTADYPVEHPLRQAAAHLVTRLALADGRMAAAAAILEKGTSHGDEWDAADAATEALEILKR